MLPIARCVIRQDGGRRRRPARRSSLPPLVADALRDARHALAACAGFQLHAVGAKPSIWESRSFSSSYSNLALFLLHMFPYKTPKIRIIRRSSSTVRSTSGEIVALLTVFETSCENHLTKVVQHCCRKNRRLIDGKEGRYAGLNLLRMPASPNCRGELTRLPWSAAYAQVCRT